MIGCSKFVCKQQCSTLLVALRFDSCEHQHRDVQVHNNAQGCLQASTGGKLAPSMLLAGVSHGLYKQSVHSTVSFSSMIMIPDGCQEQTWIFLYNIASLSTLACCEYVYAHVMPYLISRVFAEQ